MQSEEQLCNIYFGQGRSRTTEEDGFLLIHFFSHLYIWDDLTLDGRAAYTQSDFT